MKRWFTSLALLLGIVMPVAADGPPPSVHLVGDHWTAWDPPEVPPDVESYVIVSGDTLWSLAQRFYGNPYLWPQLWERNQYIKDAHWIYPGDPLIVGPQVEQAVDLETVDLGDGTAAGAETGEAPGSVADVSSGESGASGVLSAEASASAPRPLGTESDLYCSGYIGDLEEGFPARIIGAEDEALLPSLQGGKEASRRGAYGQASVARYGLATSDIIYLDAGRGSGTMPGDLLTVIEPGEPVIHPRTKDISGRMYLYKGRVRVLSVQETTSIAEVVFSCDPIFVGAQLKPFKAEPVPLTRVSVMRPASFPSPAEALDGAPVILAAKDDQFALGEDNVVFVDRGLDADITPGDIFTIYRLHPKGLPPVVLGELGILAVHEHASVAKILTTRHTVYPGDVLELK